MSKNGVLAFLVKLISIAGVVTVLALAGYIVGDGSTALTKSNEAIGEGLRLINPASTTSPMFLNALELVRSELSGSVSIMVGGLDPRVDVFGVNELLIKDLREALQAPAAALAPVRIPSPQFSRNLLFTVDLGRFPFQTEPHLYVNPLDPDHIVVGVIDYNFPTITTYVSFDGGETWEGPFQPKFLPDDLVSGGDPTVAVDREGNVYVSYLSIGIEEFSIGGAAFEAVISSIAVSTSIDGGLSWSEPIRAARGGVEVVLIPPRPETYPSGGSLTLRFLDKPWMTVGPDRNDPSRDAIYVTYTEFELKLDIIYVFGGELFYFGNPRVRTSIKLVKSTDGGITWSEPVTVSIIAERRFGSDVPRRIVQGSFPVVGRDGTVYVFWYDSLDDGAFEGGGKIWVSVSKDGGQTFPVDLMREVAELVDPPFAPRNSFFRLFGTVFPRAAVGPNNELYVVYGAVQRGKEGRDDGDIFFVRSLDGGESWSEPVRLNDDNTDSLQFFPAISVDPKGVIHVMWGDFRDDVRGASYNIYYTRSEDRGETWGFVDEESGIRIANVRVSDAPSNPNFGFPGGRFIGDYFSIASTEEDVYMVWADTRLGEFLGLNQKIAFARLRPVKSPSILVSPSFGPGGREIVITGSNFMPRSNTFVLLGDSIIASTRTDSKGEFILRIFLPVTGEGPQTIRVLDSSGNIAEATFLVEFGFDSLRDRLEAISEELTGLEAVVGEAGGVGGLRRVDNLANAIQRISNVIEEGIKPLSLEISELRTLVLAAIVASVGSLALSMILVVARSKRP